MTVEIKDWTIEENGGKKYVKVAIFFQVPDIASALVFQTVELDNRMCDNLLFETWGDLFRKGETDLLFHDWIDSIDRNAMIESMAITLSPPAPAPIGDLPF